LENGKDAIFQGPHKPTFVRIAIAFSKLLPFRGDLAIVPLKSKAKSPSALRDLKNSKDGISQGLLKSGNPGLRLKVTPKRAS